ncbi:protein containing Por secretion system C-terminal sorting domain [Lentimicrobium saccharophilum]|uniref:Protein containing Por secretion system C-terminal sorting domain n=1 Tax=Lentimicrobium saccharophilum TaxID=1678841 RepID=A0A0S7C1N4_9BACT|nr:YCF48-related protein [Lentimicrobium saccharophilum]GAP43286.1 protein containing Por secretion system C-terminal sorting domain [Lentimicrobium saccharophilum]
MKKSALLFHLLLPVCFSCFSQTWVKQESNTTSDLYSLYFINTDTGFASGSNGTIIKTNDGGSNWLSVNSNTSERIGSIHFTNILTGFAVCGSGLLKTTDAGENWFIQDTASWLTGISFINQDTGFACGSGVLLKTANGGNTWVRQQSIGGTVISFYAADADIFYIGADCSYIYKTINGGTNWDVIYGPGFPVSYYDLYFMDRDTGFAAGGGWAQGSEAGIIMKTTNGGMSWDGFSFDKTVRSVHFVNKTSGYAAGNYGTIFKTTDTGNNWSQLNSGVTENLTHIWFTDASTGYAVGENGVILKTTNGGLGIITPDNNEKDFSLFPNPFINYITINASQLTDNAEISIYTIQGLLIYKQSLRKTATQLDLSFMKPGIYFAAFTSGQRTGIIKMIKK